MLYISIVLNITLIVLLGLALFIYSQVLDEAEESYQDLQRISSICVEYIKENKETELARLIIKEYNKWFFKGL